jgi:hypothetical protein
MTKYDIVVFMDLFKIKCHSYGLCALRLILQKYSTMRDRGGWDTLEEDVEFIRPVDELPLCEFEYQLAVHVQLHTLTGVMSTNGQHLTGKGILVGGNWKETTKMYFVEDPNELRQEVSDQLQVPVRNILYQPVTVNIHYPKSNTWSQDVIEDLKDYSVAEDRQGGLQLVRSWKDALQDTISGLTEDDDLGLWKWGENHYLGKMEMFPLTWKTLLRYIKNLQWMSGEGLSFDHLV